MGFDVKYGPIAFAQSRHPHTGPDQPSDLDAAIAIIDIGLWDAAGKALGKSILRLLGGDCEKIPVIGIGSYHRECQSLQDLISEVESFLETGLSGIKLKVGTVTVQEDVRRVEALRTHFGEHLVLACDANQAWTFHQALEFTRQVSDYHLDWLEEPLRWNDQFLGLKQLRQQTRIPLVAGQGEISSLGCRDLVLGSCVDILNFDATIGGGISEWRRAAAFAEMMNVRMGHHEEPQVAVHLLASISHATYVEIFPDRNRDPLWHELIVDKPQIENGYMCVPNNPGLGLQYDWELVNRYRADR